jgi:hypothetical protein
VGVDSSAFAGDLVQTYFVTNTSGMLAGQGAGNIPNDPGITGLKSAQLKSALPPGFSPSAWIYKARRNHGWPILAAWPPPR